MRDPLQVPPAARQLRLLAACLVLLLGAACTKPTPYQPATDGYGFADRQLEDNRYLVTFDGNSATSKEDVELYLLYRAAQLTLDRGHDYFVLVQRDTEADTVYVSNTAFYGPAFGPCWGGWRPGWGYGWGWGPSYWGGPGWGCGGPAWGTTQAVPITRYNAQAEVRLFSGPVPQADPAAYDARQILANVRPGLRLPSAGD